MRSHGAAFLAVAAGKDEPRADRKHDEARGEVRRIEHMGEAIDESSD